MVNKHLQKRGVKIMMKRVKYILIMALLITVF